MDRQHRDGQWEPDADAGAYSKPDGRKWASNVMAHAIIHVSETYNGVYHATTYSNALYHAAGSDDDCYGLRAMQHVHAVPRASDAHGDGDANTCAGGDGVFGDDDHAEGPGDG